MTPARDVIALLPFALQKNADAHHDRRHCNKSSNQFGSDFQVAEHVLSSLAAASRNARVGG